MAGRLKGPEEVPGKSAESGPQDKDSENGRTAYPVGFCYRGSPAGGTIAEKIMKGGGKREKKKKHGKRKK